MAIMNTNDNRSGINTLYDLCEAAAVAIETAPGHYFQEAWKADIVESDLVEKGGAYKEACGTAYCRGGWMVTIAEQGKPNPYGALSAKAYALLRKSGIPPMECDKLFAGGAATNHTDRRPGTDAYVKEGARGLREFAAKYRTELEAIALRDRLDAEGHIIIV